LLTWFDAAYPAALRTLRDAPPVIYVRGPWSDGPKPVVAIVGTRRASAYGLAIADALGEVLARAGVVVVSGLALGIDGAAHAAVLRTDGVTVGVLGCGVDVTYPAEHRLLMEAMQQRGAVIAEAPMGMRPRKQQFPQRNRLISGLARAVVVVEGDVDSGALITARCGLAQGRQVFAVPGRVHDRTSRGPHRLITQGAKILVTPSDLFEALDLPPVAALSQLDGSPGRVATRANPPQCGALQGGVARTDVASTPPVDGMMQGARRREVRAPDPGGPEARVLAAMEDATLHIDDLTARAGLRSAEVTAVLAGLEIRGLVRQFPGKRFARCRLPSGAQGWAGRA
jgi:DNA processing protein